jgi:hypothetical protein
MLPPFAFAGTLKGNSPVSLVDKGEPVGADRMILGAPSEGDGLCISCVSFLGWPAAGGDSSRPDSSVLPDTAGDLDRGRRAVSETSVLLEPTMMTTATRKRREYLRRLLAARSRWGKVVAARLLARYTAMVDRKPAAAVTRHDGIDRIGRIC